jgi:hypothetical protein
VRRKKMGDDHTYKVFQHVRRYVPREYGVERQGAAPQHITENRKLQVTHNVGEFVS